MLLHLEVSESNPSAGEALARREGVQRRKAIRDAQTVAQQASVQSPDSLLHLASVSARVGLRRSMIYRLMQSGQFPHPVRLSLRCVRWRAGDIAAWLAEQAGGDA